MIYLGNGIYSDSGPDTLAHYGVLGMKWGVRKARRAMNEANNMDYRGNMSALKDLYKRGRITKDAYKRGKRNIKGMRSLVRQGIKQGNRIGSQKLAADIRANPSKYRGRKSSELRDRMIESHDKLRPGFKDAYNANRRLRRSQALFGVVGAAVTAPDAVRANKNYLENNKRDFYTTAELASQKPGEAEQWKAIAKQIETEQKKKKR